MTSFYLRQSLTDRQKYKRLINGVAQSRVLFSSNPRPFIHSRVAENIFCKSFSAQDVSRADVSVDAVKNKDGVGIKTFLASGVAKSEKIAEFNDTSKYQFDRSDKLRLVSQVAEYRNQRIEKTMNRYGLEHCLYHYLVRDIGRVHICECPLVPVQIPQIQLVRQTSPHIIKFHDGMFAYQFHATKNTLYKAFETKPYETVEISEDIDTSLLVEALKELSGITAEEETAALSYDFVVLPLYSTRNLDLPTVPPKSGLNQAFAGGRARNPDELYIPIPKKVHQLKPDFFPSRDRKFKLFSADNKEFSAKVCQENSKALMSDPNEALGKWLLRDMLRIPYGHQVTYEDLRKRNADTVVLYKISEDEYKIALHSFGAYEAQNLENLGKSYRSDDESREEYPKAAEPE